MNSIIFSVERRPPFYAPLKKKFSAIKLLFLFILLFLGLTNYAQAPGGVSAGLQAWYKADAGTTLSGSRVTGWNDQSGNGFNTTQGSYTGPSLTNAASNYNPGLTFASSGNYLQRTAPGIFTSGASYNNLNFYCVYNTPDAANFKWLTYQGNGTGFTRFSQSMNYSGGLNCDLDYTTGNRLSYSTSGRINVPVIVSYLASTSAISGTSKLLLYLNGGSIANSAAYTPFTGPNNPFEIGNHVFTSGDPAAPFIGNIHEIIVYTGANSITQKRQIESYLAVKYGDTLNRVGCGGNYLNSSGASIFSDGGVSTYWNNIIGIARDDNSSLSQKQSHQLDDSTRIYLSSLQTTNVANTGTFSSNNQFVMLGNNNVSMANTGSAQYPSGYGILGRMGREWQITNTGFTGTYSIDIKLPASVCTIDPSQLMLIVGSNSNLTTANVYTATNGLTFNYSGGVITIGNISTSIIPKNSTRYFTLNMNAASVGGTASSAQTICPGSTPSNLTLSGNTGSVIKWQYSTDNFVGNINDIASSAGTTLTGAQMGVVSVNTYYRAVVQNGACSTANSSVVLITTKPGPTIASVTASATNVCLGSSGNLVVSATGTSSDTTTIVNYDFNSGGSFGALAPTLATNITSTAGGSSFNNSKSGTATGSNAFTSNTSGKSLYATNNGDSWTFILGGSSLSSYSSFAVYFQAKRTNGGSSTVTLEFSTDGGTSFTTAGTLLTLSSKNTWYEGLFTALPGTDFPTSGLIFRITTNSNNDVQVDNFEVQAVQQNTTYSWIGTPSGTAGLPGGAGSALTTNNNITVTPTDTTNYTVTVANDNGCTQTGNITVNVNPISVGGSVNSNTVVCTGANSGTVYLTGQTGNVVKWQYSTDGGTSWADIPNTGTSQTYSNLTQTTIGRAVVQSGVCSSANSSPVTITVAPPGSWTGSVSTNWNDSRNWLCGQIPTSTINVKIPTGASYYPVITSGIDTAKNITIESGGSLIISGGTLQIFGTVSNSGAFDARNGTVEMKGVGAQTIDGNMFYNKTIQNLIVSNTGSGLSIASTLYDTLKVTGTLTFSTSTSKLNTGDNLTLVSDSFGTASVGKLATGNIITGKVIVERYINTGMASGQHPKTWEFLSTPTQGQTIKESWMENGAATVGYGTVITGLAGVAAGFDRTSLSPSLKYYDDVSNAWIGVANTSQLVYDPRGYMLFIRGDRTVDGVSVVNPNSTKLRTKGDLLTGTQTPISVSPGKYQSIGNPYASPVDFSLLSKTTGIDNQFYIWDPYLYGSYGLGGYQTISATHNWKPVPGGTTPYPVNVPASAIQSGQAFFVYNTSSSPATLTFKENSKVTSGVSVNFARGYGDINNEREFFSASLYTAASPAGVIADGNVVAFDKSFNDTLDGDDAIKFFNSGENFGIKRAGKILAIEAKSPVQSSDTIFYNLTNLRRQAYQIRFAPSNMETSGMEALLIDKFLHISTPLSLTDSSFVNISITADPASSASDRFKVVFRPLGALPVTFTSINAILENTGVHVQWNVENANGIQQYEIERSQDGNFFTIVDSVAAGNAVQQKYDWIDQQPYPGNNYYRVRSIGKDGQIQYTIIVKVLSEKNSASISVYPNPLYNGKINLHLVQQPAGNYRVRLLNSSGQVFLTKDIRYEGGSSTVNINYIHKLPKGIYQLEVTKPGGEAEVVKVVN